MSLARFSSSTPQYLVFAIARVVRARGWITNPSSSRTREEARGLEGFGDPCFSDRFACRHVRDGRSKLVGHWALGTFAGSRTREHCELRRLEPESVRTKVLVSSAGIEPATTDFVDQSLDNHQDEEKRRWVVGGRKRTRTPHTFRRAHCFRNRSGSIASFSSIQWSMRESNPLRRAFQTPALPIELIDRTRSSFASRGRQRTRTSRIKT